MSKSRKRTDAEKSHKPKESPSPEKQETSGIPESDQGMEQMVDDIAKHIAEQASLQEELAAAKDRAMRLQAELDNVRKRALRQIEEERLYACMPLIRDLLPVLDNMDRAVEAAEKTHDVESLLSGVKMVASQFIEALGKHDCKPIQALHEHFDPNLHHAISQMPSEEYPANVITHVAQTGFQLHDRVVRPSQVILAAGNPEEDHS